MVTLCVPSYDPAVGLNDGAETFCSFVYAALEIDEAAIPVFIAMALTVAVDVIETGEVY